jgi:hypothetical protein
MIPGLWVLIVGTAVVAIVMIRDIARDMSDR